MAITLANMNPLIFSRNFSMIYFSKQFAIKKKKHTERFYG